MCILHSQLGWSYLKGIYKHTALFGLQVYCKLQVRGTCFTSCEILYLWLISRRNWYILFMKKKTTPSTEKITITYLFLSRAMDPTLMSDLNENHQQIFHSVAAFIFHFWIIVSPFPIPLERLDVLLLILIYSSDLKQTFPISLISASISFAEIAKNKKKWQNNWTMKVNR